MMCVIGTADRAGPEHAAGAQRRGDRGNMRTTPFAAGRSRTASQFSLDFNRIKTYYCHLLSTDPAYTGATSL